MLDALSQFVLRLEDHAWWFLTILILVRKPIIDHLPFWIKDAIRRNRVSARISEWTPRSWMINCDAASGIAVASFLAFQDESDALNISVGERNQARIERDEALHQLAAIAPGSEEEILPGSQKYTVTPSAVDKEFANSTTKLERLRANEWAPLSDEEKANLVAALKPLLPHSIIIACESVNCETLSDDLIATFLDAGWSASKMGNGGLDTTGMSGISLNPIDVSTKSLKEAIEKTTGLRINLGPDGRDNRDTRPATLVVGSKSF